MSQIKRKLLKEEANQPHIKQFITTPNNRPCLSDTEEYISKHTRSRSRKRKKTSPPSALHKSNNKRINLYEPLASIKTAETGKMESEPLTLQAVKDLLKPLDERISKVLSTQEEMNTTIGEAATLRLENEKLKQRMTEVESMNKKLSKRLSKLENKLLECNIVLTGIVESTWE